MKREDTRCRLSLLTAKDLVEVFMDAAKDRDPFNQSSDSRFLVAISDPKELSVLIVCNSSLQLTRTRNSPCRKHYNLSRAGPRR